MVVTERVKLTFPPDLVNTPVLYNMSKEFGIVTNLRRADMSHGGWLVLELVGTEEAIQRSLSWARELGVRVEPVEAETPQ